MRFIKKKKLKKLCTIDLRCLCELNIFTKTAKHFKSSQYLNMVKIYCILINRECFIDVLRPTITEMIRIVKVLL